MPYRAVVHVGLVWTTKRYRTADEAAQEAWWYERVPWATPPLVCQDGQDLIFPTLPVASSFPAWRPVEGLRSLLSRLHAQGVHHRDVHTKNVVMGRDGEPLLIDWETATEHTSEHSYDLHGPETSGVPVPDLHERLQIAPQWWGSGQSYSIGVEWRDG